MCTALTREAHFLGLISLSVGMMYARGVLDDETLHQNIHRLCVNQFKTLALSLTQNLPEGISKQHRLCRMAERDSRVERNR